MECPPCEVEKWLNAVSCGIRHLAIMDSMTRYHSNRYVVINIVRMCIKLSTCLNRIHFILSLYCAICDALHDNIFIYKCLNIFFYIFNFRMLFQFAIVMLTLGKHSQFVGKYKIIKYIIGKKLYAIKFLERCRLGQFICRW